MSNHDTTHQRRRARASKRSGLVLGPTGRVAFDLTLTHHLVTAMAIHQRNRQEIRRDTRNR